MRRVFAQALLALHLVVLVVGGALAARAPAQASVHRAVISVVAGGGDAPTVVSTTEGRIELATRTRGERGERGGSPPLDFVLPSSAVSIAPASLTGSLALPSASSPHRLLPSVVHGPRGPPRAC